MEQKPMPGELYRHFKNKLYQVIAVATHSETGEELVIYQALYGDFGIYARPLDMFTSEVDHVKYPDVAQKYRFEKVNVEKTDRTEPAQLDTTQSAVTEPVQPANVQSAVTEAVSSGSSSDGVDPKLMAFLETESFEERYNILVSMQDHITDSMIDTMAVVMDTVIPEGDIYKRYDDLKYVIRTRQQYEFANRLR